MIKTALVLGAGGFIGSHLVKRLKNDGFWVRGVDLKYPKWSKSPADDFVFYDLRSTFSRALFDRPLNHVYQLAADMGGAGYVFTGENDASILRNNALINLQVAEAAVNSQVERLFFASSACVYPEYNQKDPKNIKIAENTVYPADPNSEYGWEKLFSERLYAAYARCRGLDVRIGRFHNVYGPEGSYNDGREKAPAAICRKVAIATDDAGVVIWGDGKQTRSFLYIDDALNGIAALMASTYTKPVNIGSEEMVSIDDLVRLVAGIAGKHPAIMHVPGPVGVAARTSDNTLARQVLHWEPRISLATGIAWTYEWIAHQMGATHG